jgi:hypothetical protein
MIQLIIPSAEFHAEADTLASGADSLLITGHIHFLPEPINLRQFTEKIFNQYLKTAIRNSRYQFTLVFNEPVNDTLDVKLIEDEYENWYMAEPNAHTIPLLFG